MLVSRKRLAGAVGLAVVASGLLLPASPAQASSAPYSNLLISEVYGGDGSGSATYHYDYVELFNPTSSPVVIAANSLYLSYAASGTATSGTGIALPGTTIPAYTHYLLETHTGTGANPVNQHPPHVDATIAMPDIAGAGAKVFLQNTSAGQPANAGDVTGNSAIIDAVSASGLTAKAYEGAEGTVAGSATTSLQRKDDAAHGYLDTNTTASDLKAAAPTPKGTLDGALPLGGDPVALAGTNPGNKTATRGQAITGFTLGATGGTAPYHWTATGLPAGVSVADGGAVSGTPSESGTFNVTATVADSAATPATKDVSFTITVNEPATVKPIADVQGTGAASPEVGNTVAVEGIVTAMYRTGGLNGMYVQTAGTGGASDATPDASDAIFVYGSNSMPAGIAIGDSVRVAGPVSEFNGATQITPAAGGVVELETPLAAVTPRTIAYPTTETGREAQEGMLLAPSGDFTVTNVYSTNQYAEIGLAAGTTPLEQWSEFASPHDLDAINAIKAANAERAVVLDDGQSTNFLGNNTTKAIPLPWLSPSNAIRVGAAATFTGPVVLEYRNAAWKFQPTHPVTDSGADVATFEDTRADNLVPRNVLGTTGDLKIATFNVLNYFNTTGEAYVASGPNQSPPIVTHCSYYNDREGNRIGNDQCGVKQPGETYTSSNPNDGRGPRGAATAASLARQEAKLAHTLNALDADIVGLEEVENSIKLPGETNRDDALARIVELVNTDARETRWAYVKSPGEAMTAAAIGEQDVIRPAFIYQIDAVKPVGQSDILFGTDQFANAREPLAQAFKAKGAPDSDAFAVIVNHFKSKGDNASPAPPATGDNTNDAATGVGAFNGDRVRQSQRLLQFAHDFAADRDIEAVFLAGDFNAYTMEDPITTLEAGGFKLIDSTDSNDESYSYSGLSGSLDHVLGNQAAFDMVTGADIWEINADESPAFQYSRYNYNATDFFQPNLPFATSDHNPEIIGIDVPDVASTPYREIQVLGTNDFHGRLLPDSGNAAGAAPFATAVKELKQDVPDSIFVAAGDLVGASTFESFIQDDEPTIDALNAMGLEVSAAGNHEFDRGYADLEGRIRDRADWQYIAANLDYADSIAPADQLAETFTKTFDVGGEALKVGFVGAVTEDLRALVNPAGIAGITVTDVVTATNAAARKLKEDGADLVVLLVHEGAPSTECSAMTDPATTWGNIVENTSADVDAIISGHTHLAYNCRFPVADWVSGGRAVTKRPVVSAGQYGTNLNQLVFKFDSASGDLAAVSQDVIAVAGVGYTPDPQVQAIVDDAVTFANTAGSEVLGTMDGPFNRAQYVPASGATENRGGESTLGNQVAEAQRWATDTAGIDTDIAFMNPGGLRADMAGTVDGDHRKLSYRQAADVQPFANTLVNMDLTGAQIETVLEQQWQRNAQGGVPSRPFLRLGVSKGFTYTYTQRTDPAHPGAKLGEVTGMWLDGEAVDPAATYSVTVNSFLASGGDNFWELANGAHKQDTGVTDLQAMVDYAGGFADAGTSVPIDRTQHAVDVTFPNGAPTSYAPGAHVRFDLASLSMTDSADLRDSEVEIALGKEPLGVAPVTTTVSSSPDNSANSNDDAGTASVDVVIPVGAATGQRTLVVRGTTTGTLVRVPITVTAAPTDPTGPTTPTPVSTTTTATAAPMTYGTDGSVQVTVTPGTASGAVTVTANGVQVGSGSVSNGAGTVAIGGTELDPGTHTLLVRYAGNATHNPSQGSASVVVTKAKTTLAASAAAVDFGSNATIGVTATPKSATGSITVSEGDKSLGSASLVDGAATITAGAGLEPGTHSLVIRYAGDTRHAEASTTVTLEVRKVASSTSATVVPAEVPVKAGTAKISVTVGAGDAEPTGTVVALISGRQVASATLVDGRVTLEAGPFDSVGAKSIEIRYSGDDRVAGSTASASVKVVKAKATVDADHKPQVVKAGKTRARLSVTVQASGFTPTGSVRVTLPNGDVLRGQLEDGQVTIVLPKFGSAGTKVVTIGYGGNALTEAATVRYEIKVGKRK